VEAGEGFFQRPGRCRGRDPSGDREPTGSIGRSLLRAVRSRPRAGTSRSWASVRPGQRAARRGVAV